MQKHIGRTVTIIYQDRKGEITQRRILIQSVKDGVIHAFDQDKKASRRFETARILAMQPVNRYAS